MIALRIFPDDVLREKSIGISRIDSSIRRLAQSMLDIMYENCGVGLAAPQVGMLKRMIVIDDHTRGLRNPLILINPELIKKEGSIVGTEGCLSFPEVFFEVKRHNNITVTYQDLSGETINLHVMDNLLCRIIQHEMDHLDGILFIDRRKK